MQKTKMPTITAASILNEHRLATALKFTVISVAVVALYFPDLNMVFTGALTDEASFHILAIPFLFAYLLFRKRKMINATLQPTQTAKAAFQKNLSTFLGISLCAVAIFTYWYGSYSFTPLEFHMATLPFLVAGLTLILFNLQTVKQLIFPIAFLIFLTPPPSEILYGVGSALASVSASVSNGLVNLFGIPAVLSSSNGSPLITLTRPDQTVLPFSINVACSGIYSILGFVIFALFIAYIMTGSRLRNKIAILVLGIPLIVGLNIIRITTILAIGYNWGEDLALQVFHTFGATVLMFIGTLILLAVTEKAFKKPKQSEPCLTCSPAPASQTEPFCPSCGKLFKFPKTKLHRVDLAKIAGVLVFVVMLVSIQAPVFALMAGPAQVVVQTPSGPQVNVSNSLLPNVTGYTLSYVYRDSAFEKLAGQDASLVYAYSPDDNSSKIVWVAIEIASSTISEHRWETCLINFPLSQGNEASVSQLDLRDVQISDNPPITARYFAFQYVDRNQTQAVLYWYQTASFNINGTTQMKSIKMSLVTYPASPAEVTADENQELPVAVAINNYWQPIKTWSTIALTISQNGLMLSIGALAIFIVLVAYSSYLSVRDRRSLLTLQKKLPAQDQLLLEVISKNSTTQAVIAEFQKASPNSVSETFVLEKLVELEKTGLIKKRLVNKTDNPVFVWEVPGSRKAGLLSKMPFLSFFG
jgi:exosortase